MTDAGLQVTVVSGGEYVPVIDDSGMEFVQLPAIRAEDRTFKTLVNMKGAQLSDALKEKRRNKLLNILKFVIT